MPNIAGSQDADTNLLGSGYVDLQLNGYVGVDFNDPKTTSHQLQQAAQALHNDGVSAVLPTIITADLDSMCRCIANVVGAMATDPLCGALFRGVHIEGPFLSPEPGYIGAHPAEHALAACANSLDKLFDAAQGMARLLTLAPEVDCDGVLTRACVQRGCLVAAGHTNASLQDLQRAVDAGLSLFTHLGNGCPRMLDRHDNIIYRALRFRDRLTYTLIADSFHIPEVLFRNLLDWIDSSRLCVVSDAISATGLGPGEYQLGLHRVRIGPDKAAWDAEGQHFVGAASSMRDADRWLAAGLGLGRELRLQLLSQNPARLLGL
ncbi:MAG: N-acetylglucosamine-6-phosphate deacetylase [Pirellulaceae bacterium]|nr:N-acetylglucosamine-6-phosphate deacetylase [Pirellulaceae bacterium]